MSSNPGSLGDSIPHVNALPTFAWLHASGPFHRRYTYADYRTWPDDERWELIDGVAWNMSPAPSTSHQAILGELHLQVAPSLKGTRCRVFRAPFDLLLPGSRGKREDEVADVVQPDLTGICGPARVTERGCFGAPDWVVDPGSRTVHVYRLEESGRYGEAAIHESDATIPCPIGSAISVGLPAVFAEARVPRRDEEAAARHRDRYERSPPSCRTR
jgi:Uma2 family endonuclease